MNNLIFFFLLMCLASPGLSQQEFSISINGQNFPVDLNRSFTYITETGDSVIFELTATGAIAQTSPPTTSFQNSGNSDVYEDLMIRFSYPENFAVATTQPATGLQQITLISGNGAGVIIQEFSSINTTSLSDFLLTQLVGESAASNAQPVNQSLGGQQVQGLRTRDDDGNDVVVYNYSKANQGVLIAMIGDSNSSNILLEFIRNLELKF